MAPIQPDTQSEFGEYGSGGWRRLIWRVCNAPVFSAALRRKLRKRIARRFAGPFDVVHEGIHYRLYPAENHCDRVIFSRNALPEQREHDALKARIKPGMVFIDVGANVGTYSLQIAKEAGDHARILALEPHPHTVEKLRFNCHASGFGTIEIVQAASGPERGSLTLWSDGGGNIGHTSLLKEGTSVAKIGVSVDVVPLADLVIERGFERIDLIKIDIEGFEDQVLIPYFASAPRHLWPKAVLIETAHEDIWKHDVLADMRNRGYHADFETAENQLLVLDGS